MKAIVIAAGPCTRLRPLTDDNPKCMLKIKGKPLLQNTLELFRNNGIDDISIIRGYKKEKINYPNITYFENNDFWDNNILHSLMYARTKLEEAMKAGEDVVVSYSDIWYSDSVVKDLIKSKDPIASVVDTDWKSYYDRRIDHPISEAENVVFDDNKYILKIGKHILNDIISNSNHGEFIGLWKFTTKGIKTFLKHFDRLNSTLKKTEPYQNTKEWQKSYITDIFQELIDQGEKVNCVLIQKNWMEFDTVQDFERFSKNEKEELE